MRKADLKKNHAWFEEKLAYYDDFFARTINAKQVLNTSDKREIAESSLLRLCAYWEAFVGEELVDCVNIDGSKLGEFVGTQLPQQLSLAMCEAILFRERYLDFRSVGEIKGFAKKVLPDKVNPFAKIPKHAEEKIDEAFVIRNYLSHQSKAARRRLSEMYRAKYQRRRFAEPGGFLLAKNSKRLVEYVGSFFVASKEMAKII